MTEPRQPVFLATNRGGVAHAEYAGTAWSVTHVATPARSHALAADPASGAAYVGTSNGVLRSSDSGKSWSPAGLDRVDVRALAASPAQAGLLFAGARPCALFVSRDGGSTWSELPAFRALARWRAFFSPAEWPPTPYVSAIATSCGDAARIVVGMEVGGVAVTADGGETWRVGRGAIYDCHSLSAHPRDPLRFYEGGAGWAKAGRTSGDGGVTWTGPASIEGNAYGWASVGDPATPDRWYYAASSSPFKAHNDGRADAALYRVAGTGRAERVADGLPQSMADMPYQLLNHGSVIYMGLANGAVWRLTAGSQAWERLPPNLGGIHRTLLVL